MKAGSLSHLVKQEANRFALALGFFSRIPMPAWVRYSPQELNRCCRYFSLVGWLLGGLMALVFMFFQPLLGDSLAVILTLVAGVLLTGAFHEDGLADTCDGLGGGLTVKRKLEIMKDSRIGTYGLVGLVLVLLLKWQALVLLDEQAPFALLLMAPLSRALSTSLMGRLRYLTEDRLSKSKPLVTQARLEDLSVAVVLAVLPALILAPVAVLACLLAMLLLHGLLVVFYRRALGGYTGDMLGAAQQISEVTGYLVWVAWGGL